MIAASYSIKERREIVQSVAANHKVKSEKGLPPIAALVILLFVRLLAMMSIEYRKGKGKLAET